MFTKEQLKALIGIPSGKNPVKYLEGTKWKGVIFKFAAISGSMEAFFPDKCSNADKEICEGMFSAKTGDNELLDSLHKLLGND